METELKTEFKKLHKRLDRFEGKFDEMEAKFATKDDLKIALDEQSKDLKSFAEEQTEHLARIIATTVAEPLDQHLRDATLYEEVTMNVWKKLAKQKKF